MPNEPLASISLNDRDLEWTPWLRDIEVKNPVLILGAGLRLTLTIARSLHRQGIPVIVASLTDDESPIRSHAIQKQVRLPDFRAKSDKFIHALTALIEAEKVDMIMPTGDGALAAISKHYDVLQRLAHVGAPPPTVIERVLDKNLTLRAAQKCRIPVPASRVIEDPSKLDQLLEGLQFPLIAKPSVRKGNSNYKIKYFENKEKLLTNLSEDSGSLRGALLQEYIPGVGKGIGVLMHNGVPMAMFQHRRIKEFPYTGGVSVTAEAEVIDPALGDHAVALLQEIEWQGIAMVEYRYNPNDNRFALMEINGRYWGSLFLATRAGVNFPYYEWQLAHGEQPKIAKAYAPGIRVRWLVGDVLRLHGIISGSHFSEIEPVSRGKEVVRFVRDFGFRSHDAVFLLSDPLPALQELWETLSSLIKTDVKTFASRILPKSILAHLRIYRNLPSQLRPIFLRQVSRRALGIQPILFRPGAKKINKVLFVCLGNIIRSPTAAVFLQQRLVDTEIKSLDIASAGLWKGLTQNDPRSSPDLVITIAAEWDISLKTHRSQPITRKLIDACDAIFVMDYQNESMLLLQYPDAKHKVFLLGACVKRIPAHEWEIADPYGGTADEIRKCVSTIDDRISGLAQILNAQGKADIDFDRPINVPMADV